MVSKYIWIQGLGRKVENVEGKSPRYEWGKKEINWVMIGKENGCEKLVFWKEDMHSLLGWVVSMAKKKKSVS